MNRINILLERYKALPEVCEIIRALGVIALTPAIRAWLEAHDPKALAQIEMALKTELEGREYPAIAEANPAARLLSAAVGTALKNQKRAMREIADRRRMAGGKP